MMAALVRGPAPSKGPAAALLALLLTIAALSALLAPAAAAGVPSLDLAKWNQAYKLTVTNLTEEDKIYPELHVPTGDACKEVGFNSDPAAAELNSCFTEKQSNGTYSFWTKVPGGDWRDDSNCYCYALNVYTGGFCVPGSANGTDPLRAADLVTCDLMRQAVVADGGKPVSREEALSGQPASGHYIAIMVRGSDCNPYHCWDADFHAARKDSNGLWSWKEPAGPASDRDLFGNTISDPESAIMFGHYDEFCGYFQVDPDSMTIGGSFDEQTMADLVKDYQGRLQGAHTSLQATPYNQTVDGAFDESRQQLFDEDVLWESKRGTKEWEEYYKKKDEEAAGSGSSSSSGSASAAASGRKMLRNRGI